MKTRNSNLWKIETGWILAFVMAVMVFIPCCKNSDDNPKPMPAPENYEVYTVNEQGGMISAFDHTVWLRIPKGAFDSETTIRISSITTDFSLNSYRLAKRGVMIDAGNIQPKHPFALILTYHLAELGLVGEGEDIEEVKERLNILGFPCIYGGSYDTSECIPQVGGSHVDCFNQSIETKFPSFGVFVVGKEL